MGFDFLILIGKSGMVARIGEEVWIREEWGWQKYGGAKWGGGWKGRHVRLQDRQRGTARSFKASNSEGGGGGGGLEMHTSRGKWPAGEMRYYDGQRTVYKRQRETPSS